MTPAHPRTITTLRQLIARSVRRYGEHTAFILPSQDTITYTQFGSDIQALGTALLHRGMDGKRIAIIGKNSYEWGLSYMTVMNGVGLTVPLDKELSVKELIDSIQRVNVDVIFYSDDVKQKIDSAKRAVKGLQCIAMSAKSRSLCVPGLLAEGRQFVQDGDRSYEHITIDPHAMAALLFTSGTTSQSKIVMLSHSNIVTDMLRGVEPFHVSPDDRFLSILPLHHMFECNAGFIAPLYCGSSIYFSQGIRSFADELKTQRPTIIICVPRIIDALSDKIWKGVRKQKTERLVRLLIRLTNSTGNWKHPLKRRAFGRIHDEFGGRLRFFLSGAAAVNHQTARGMVDLGFTIYQGYGLTECSPAVALTNAEYDDLDSVGQPLHGTTVKIRNPDTQGIGEILVRGPHVMLGYYNNPDATKQVIKDGFFYTGDLGYIKPNGCLKIIGRQKNIIVTDGGKKIYPEEIESLILATTAIKDAVVHEVASRHGPKVGVTIVLNDTATSHERAALEKSARAHIDTINQDLAPYEQIRAITIRETDFVRTSTLKIKRHLLAK